MDGGRASAVSPGARRLLRSLLETRGTGAGRIPGSCEARLAAAEGVPLVASYLPGPPIAPVAVLLVHGFAAHRRKPSYRRAATALAERFPVLILDLRGHGGSGGSCTFGGREVEDVLAGTRWLTAFGHERVVAVGVSMGATAVLQAVSAPIRLEGAVAVSIPEGPGELRDRTPPVDRLEALWRSRSRRWAFRMLTGVRLERPETCPPPPRAVELASRADAPLLLVHGEDDPYFPISVAESVRTAAPGSAVLWREPTGFGHAEDGLSAVFLTRLCHAIGELAISGRFPSVVNPGE